LPKVLAGLRKVRRMLNAREELRPSRREHE
jgi:hypothetical protein